MRIQRSFDQIILEKFQIVIVPGYTPVKATEGVEITKRSIKRLEKALKVMRKTGTRFIAVSGGNVHPDGTPYNEAWGMKNYLMQQLDVAEDAIILDPYARHSTTNLRNVGRFMLAHKLTSALIVTSAGQSFYFSNDGISTFNKRCKDELGYQLGDLHLHGVQQTVFEPHAAVFTHGTDILDP